MRWSVSVRWWHLVRLTSLLFVLYPSFCDKSTGWSLLVIPRSAVQVLTRSAPGTRSWVCKPGVQKCHAGPFYNLTSVYEKGQCNPFSIFGSLLPYWQQPLHEWHDKERELPRRHLFLPPMFGGQRDNDGLPFDPFPIDKSWKYNKKKLLCLGKSLLYWKCDTILPNVSVILL